MGDLEDRVRDLEAWRDQMSGAQKMFLWIFGGVVGLLTLLATFWDKLFH